MPSSSGLSAFADELKRFYLDDLRHAYNRQVYPLLVAWNDAVRWLEQREQQRNDAAAADLEWPWPKWPDRPPQVCEACGTPGDDLIVGPGGYWCPTVQRSDYNQNIGWINADIQAGIDAALRGD